MVTRTAAIAIERYRHELSRSKADEQRVLLLRELNHRVKNVFALTNSLLAMTARSASSVEELTASVLGRLHALSRAHELVQPALGIDDGFVGRDVSLRDLLNEILAPYASEGDRTPCGDQWWRAHRDVAAQDHEHCSRIT